jgi:hypothetical protein
MSELSRSSRTGAEEMSRTTNLQLTCDGIVGLHKVGKSVLGDDVWLIEIAKDYVERCRHEADAITFADARDYAIRFTDLMKAAGQHFAKLPVELLHLYGVCEGEVAMLRAGLAREGVEIVREIALAPGGRA